MEEKFMQEAIELSKKTLTENCGGPFGCVVVKDGEIIGRGWNQVTSKNDPTAHAEILAIREACQKLNSFQLEGCEVYTSCYPCPMCLGAIYWARPSKVFYANTAEDAAQIYFDDAFIYQEVLKKSSERIIPFRQILSEEAKQVFTDWSNKEDKIQY